MLTCKKFLRELDEYLHQTLDPAVLADLQKHVDECPNCWVVCDTTRRTLKIYKGCEAQPVPQAIQDRLMAALRKKMEEEGPCCKHSQG